MRSKAPWLSNESELSKASIVNVPCAWTLRFGGASLHKVTEEISKLTFVDATRDIEVWTQMSLFPTTNGSRNTIFSMIVESASSLSVAFLMAIFAISRYTTAGRIFSPITTWSARKNSFPVNTDKNFSPEMSDIFLWITGPIKDPVIPYSFASEVLDRPRPAGPETRGSFQ